MSAKFISISSIVVQPNLTLSRNNKRTLNDEVAIASNIYPFNAVPAKHVITNRIDRVLWIEKLLQAHAHLGVIIFGDKAFKDAVLNG